MGTCEAAREAGVEDRTALAHLHGLPEVFLSVEELARVSVAGSESVRDAPRGPVRARHAVGDKFRHRVAATRGGHGERRTRTQRRSGVANERDEQEREEPLRELRGAPRHPASGCGCSALGVARGWCDGGRVGGRSRPRSGRSKAGLDGDVAERGAETTPPSAGRFAHLRSVTLWSVALDPRRK